jgi:hypothetical protein
MEAKELLVYRALEKIQNIIDEAIMKDDSGFVKENLSDFADRVKIRLDGFVSDCYNADAQRALANEIIEDIDEHIRIYKNLPEAIVVNVRYIDEPGEEWTGTILIDKNKEDKDFDYLYRTSSKEIGELKEEIRELCSRLNHYTNWYIDEYCGMH